MFKIHLPYGEADHIFNIAWNLLAGGTCLEHLEHHRNDEAYLDALDAQRIPAPTTAGDCCRRLNAGNGRRQPALLKTENAARFAKPAGERSGLGSGIPSQSSVNVASLPRRSGDLWAFFSSESAYRICQSSPGASFSLRY